MRNSLFVSEGFSSKEVKGLVSIIMPVFNTPLEYFLSAVSSVLNQTYQDIELIIVDDGSENIYADTWDILLKNERVKVIHIKNSGVSTARNIGLNESIGEFILFVDSDDTMTKEAVQIMVNQISDNDFVSIGCRHVAVTNLEYNDIPKRKVFASNIDCINYLCYMNPPFFHIETNSIWGKLYRRVSIGDIRFDVEMIMGEDFKFNYDFMMKIKKGVFLDYVGYNYFEHERSLSRSYKPKMLQTITIMKEMLNNSKNLSIFDALLSRCVNIAFTILIMLPEGLNEERVLIENFISIYRYQVLKNPCTKRKVKIACILSYVSYDLMKNIYLFFKKSLYYR